MKKRYKVALIGLGYVGLPLYLLSYKKFVTLGFDYDKLKISKLKKSISYISDIKNSQLKKISKNNFFSMREIDKIQFCNFIILCLPTPLKNNKPDMSHIEDVVKKIYPYLKKNQTIVLESSVYPGATEDILTKPLSKKFSLGKNFFLGYSPERVDPGLSKHYKKMKYDEIPKLAAGYTKKCLKRILFFYKSIFKNVCPCRTIKIAETAKIFENTFRSVNIGLVNEMKILASKMDINIHEVIDAAATKPFGFRKFSPGPGVGGHCIPIDPIFMKWVAKKHKIKKKFIDLGTKVNNEITKWTINKLLKIFKNRKLKCLLLGVTYKPDINDTRESPSLKILNSLLIQKNLSIDYQDPYINEIKINKTILKNTNVRDYGKYDYCIICTNHSNFKYKKIFNECKKIIDTRGIYKNIYSNKLIHL